MDCLRPTDYFGFIQLSRSMEFDNIRLEEKELNQHVKERYIQRLEHNQNKSQNMRRRADAKEDDGYRSRLEQALYISLNW